MAALADLMPPVTICSGHLSYWGQLWLGTNNPETGNKKNSEAFDRQQSMNFASFIDYSFAKSLSIMLGKIPIIESHSRKLTPPHPDCVEIGNIRIIGGVRPQSFDVAYRPDGPRVVFDSKTLNDEKSVRKNWQNMINDLATEATTVHTRFPFAIVVFIVVIPRKALAIQQEADLIRTLERLGTRKTVNNQVQLAEAISLIIWDPKSGTVDPNVPPSNSILRIEKLPEIIYNHYLDRYKGLPPHNLSTDTDNDN